ncbi:MAG: hypothetical protein J0M02_10770, partial [Planctomycetes bacterium]|nr:hypothetical protein [Planctomycetota bacterium]
MLFHNASDERLHLVRAEQALKRLRLRHVADSMPLQATLALAEGRPLFAQRPQAGMPVAEGAVWGRDWQTGWFHLTGAVPADWAGREVQLWLDITGEGLLYRPDGSAVQAITSGSVFDPTATRHLVPIMAPARGGERIDLWLEGAACSLFGILPPGGDHS